MPKSGYERLKEYRLRQSTGEQLPKCKMCDACGNGCAPYRDLKGKKSLERGVYSYCYPKTQEGRTANKEAVERHRSKQ